MHIILVLWYSKNYALSALSPKWFPDQIHVVKCKIRVTQMTSICYLFWVPHHIGVEFWVCFTCHTTNLPVIGSRFFVTLDECPMLVVVMEYCSNWSIWHIAENRYGVKAILFRVQSVISLLTTKHMYFIARFRETNHNIFEWIINHVV